MTDTAIVKWVPVSRTYGKFSLEHDWVNILVQEPKPLLQYLAAKRQASSFLRCPAFVDSCKNTYVIESPVDMRIVINRAENWLHVENQSQAFAQEFIATHAGKFNVEDPYILTVPPILLFFAGESVTAEVLPAFLSPVPNLTNTSVIPGRFDIGRWVRPIDCTMEVYNTAEPLEIKAGDPLLYVRFSTPEGKKVLLDRVMMDDRLEKAIQACVAVKTVRPNMKLNDLYEAGEAYLNTLLADFHTED